MRLTLGRLSLTPPFIFMGVRVWSSRFSVSGVSNRYETFNPFQGFLDPRAKVYTGLHSALSLTRDAINAWSPLINTPIYIYGGPCLEFTLQRVRCIESLRDLQPFSRVSRSTCESIYR